MECPNCRHSLVTLEFAETEIDYCVGCRGIWLDAGELELLLERQGADQSYLETVRPARPAGKGRRCPVCHKIMPRILVGDNAIELDRCERHGLWFDRRELRQVLAESASGPLAEVLDAMLASDRE